MANVIEDIKRFRDLKPGWNSYKAPGISEAAINAAIAVVEAASRRRAPAPVATPTPLGGIALTWELPNDVEAQLLVDEASFEYSIAGRYSPKVTDEGSLPDIAAVERGFIERYLLRA